MAKQASMFNSYLFTIGYISTGMVAGIICLLLSVLPFRLRFKICMNWNKFVMVWVRWTCGIKFEIKGQKPDFEPYVVMSKHSSTWETMFLQYYFLPISTVLKKVLLKVPFFGWGLAILKPIAIDRSNPIQALKQIKKQGKARLEEGINVLIYPEGTRIPFGERGNYARSGADIAKAAGVPIVPIAHDAGYFWPNKDFIKKPGTITVVIGEPIDTSEKSSKELAKEVEEWIEGQIAQMPTAGKQV